MQFDNPKRYAALVILCMEMDANKCKQRSVIVDFENVADRINNQFAEMPAEFGVKVMDEVVKLIRNARKNNESFHIGRGFWDITPMIAAANLESCRQQLEFIELRGGDYSTAERNAEMTAMYNKMAYDWQQVLDWSQIKIRSFASAKKVKAGATD